MTNLRRFFYFCLLALVFITSSYLCLCLIWIMLGAVINPTAFLPYATACATWVTTSFSKYKEFKETIEGA